MDRSEVIGLIDTLGSRIGAPYDAKTYPWVYDSFDEVENDGRSVYLDGKGDIHVTDFSRGKLIRDTTDPDPIIALFPVIRGKAWGLAFEYASARSVEGRDRHGSDWRRMLFRKELELLDRVLPLYAEMEAKYIHGILRDNPFMDGRPTGCFLCKYLVRNWFHDILRALRRRTAWAMPGGDCLDAAVSTLKE